MSKPSIIRIMNSKRIRWAGHEARMEYVKNVNEVLIGKTEGKRRHGRIRRRWEDNVTMDLRETGWGIVDWINVAQDSTKCRVLVNSVINLRVP
jgi:hypothetical protein